MANYDFWNDRTDKRVRFCEYNNFALSNKNFVISGCEVTSNATGLDVDIASGEIFINDTKVTVTGANQVLTTADPSQDRCDLIVVNSSGVISKIDGTPGTPPATPNYAENDYVVLAFVIVEDGVINLPDADIFNIGLENDNIMTDDKSVLSYLGSGSDGAITISTNTTLYSSMEYSTLTINTGITLSLSYGVHICVSGTLTNNGTIESETPNIQSVPAGGSGGSGQGGNGGAGGLGGGICAIFCYTIAGTGSIKVLADNGSNGGSGGSYDTGNNQSGNDGTDGNQPWIFNVELSSTGDFAGKKGMGGTPATTGTKVGGATGNVIGQSLNSFFNYIVSCGKVNQMATGGGGGEGGERYGNNGNITGASGGGGGSSIGVGGAGGNGSPSAGTGQGASGGGGGGAGAGGILVLIALNDSSATQSLYANGGDGGDGGSGYGGAGGGGAGGGGVILQLTETQYTTDVTGGTGGTKAGTASDGANGSSGQTWWSGS